MFLSPSFPITKVSNKNQESMTTILAIVTAEKDGQIESKMIKARQMEEIREARKAEAEAQLEVGARVFERLLDVRGRRLADGVQLLAAAPLQSRG